MRSAAPFAVRLAAAPLLASVALLAAACGSSGTPGGGPATTVTVTSSPPTSTPAQPSSAPPASSPAPAGPAACSTAALKVSIGSNGGGAAGSAYVPLDFTNISGSTCTLYGYPGVSFVTSAGAQVGAAADRRGTTPLATITLAPGAVGHATLQVVDAGNFPTSRCGQLVSVPLLKIYPPNQFTAVTVPYQTQACTSKSLVTLFVSTISAGG